MLKTTLSHFKHKIRNKNGYYLLTITISIGHCQVYIFNISDDSVNIGAELNWINGMKLFTVRRRGEITADFRQMSKMFVKFTTRDTRW